MSSQLPVSVSVARSIAHGAAEAGHRASGSHLTFRVGVLTRQSKVEEVEKSGRRACSSAHGKVGGFNVTVEETTVVHRLDGIKHLGGETHHSAEREDATGHAATQLSQISTLRDRSKVMLEMDILVSGIKSIFASNPNASMQ